jgi:hypothetical protein
VGSLNPHQGFSIFSQRLSIFCVIAWVVFVLMGPSLAMALSYSFPGALQTYVQPLSDRGFQLGPLKIRPGVGVAETYTDNLFLEPDGDYDFVTTISPFLDLTLPFGRHSFEVLYQSDFIEPAHFSEYSVDHHFIDGYLNFDFPGGLVIRVGNEWMYNSNPPTFKGDYLYRYNRNTTPLEVTYSFTDRYSVGLRYAHEFVRYTKELFEVDNIDQDNVILDLNYRILPKTTVFLEGGWAYQRFPERVLVSTDNNEYHIWLGATTTPAAKIVGTLAGGYTRRVYEDDQAGGPVDGFNVKGNLYYLLTPRTRISLEVFSLFQSTYFTTTDNPIYGSTYRDTSVTLGISQAFSYRLTASASVGYGNLDFSGEGPVATVSDRQDNLYLAEASLEYKIWKYIGLGLQYNFVKDDSNVGSEDYTENRVTFAIDFRL